MRYFWTYETKLPSSVRWNLFGREHIIWLVLLTGSTIAILWSHGQYLKKRSKTSHHGKSLTGKTFASPLFNLMAFLSLSWQIAQAVYRIVLGVYGIDTLPLHICSMASYLVFLYALTNWKWLGEILYFPLLPGAFLAILFPDWTMYPAFSFMSIAGFLVHWSIDMTVLLALQDGRLRPSVHRIWSPMLFLTIYAVILIPFDHRFQVNYGFLNVPSPGSPLIAIANVFGSGAGYYVGYAMIVAACMAVAYLIVYLQHK